MLSLQRDSDLYTTTGGGNLTDTFPINRTLVGDLKCCTYFQCDFFYVLVITNFDPGSSEMFVSS